LTPWISSRPVFGLPWPRQATESGSPQRALCRILTGFPILPVILLGHLELLVGIRLPLP
jgi:hypothetical protein